MSLCLPLDLSGLSYLRLDGHLLIRPEDLDAFVQQKVEAAVQRVEAHYHPESHGFGAPVWFGAPASADRRGGAHDASSRAEKADHL